MAAGRYTTPFLRHLSFFDRAGTGIITFGSSVRANLALGLNFPVSMMMAIGMHLFYGNAPPLGLGVRVSEVKSQRTMLQNMDVDEKSRGYTRSDMLKATQGASIMDRMHIIGLWALAADPKSGLVSPEDLKTYQNGEMLPILEERRKYSREQQIPLVRGGPGSVAGHSWFVEKLFGVEVYKNKKQD